MMRQTASGPVADTHGENRVLFQYRIFPVVPFRRIVLACGVFVLAFGTASTISLILACTPVSDFWLSLSGGLKSKLRGNCISIRRLLLINGGINTFTDIALLILVGHTLSGSGSPLH